MNGQGIEMFFCWQEIHLRGVFWQSLCSFLFFLIFTFTAANYMRQLLERTYLSYFFIFDGVFGPTRVSFSGCFGPL